MSRYPYTESADFIRELQQSYTNLSRSEAAQMKEECAKICKIDEFEMAKIFADAARFRKIKEVMPLLFMEESK